MTLRELRRFVESHGFSLVAGAQHYKVVDDEGRQIAVAPDRKRNGRGRHDANFRAEIRRAARARTAA